MRLSRENCRNLKGPFPRPCALPEPLFSADQQVSRGRCTNGTAPATGRRSTPSLQPWFHTAALVVSHSARQQSVPRSAVWAYLHSAYRFDPQSREFWHTLSVYFAISVKKNCTCRRFLGCITSIHASFAREPPNTMPFPLLTNPAPLIRISKNCSSGMLLSPILQSSIRKDQCIC